MEVLFAFILSFIVTWSVVLTPPVIAHWCLGQFGKWQAIAFVGVMYLLNVVIFVSLGSESKSHTALAIGALISFYLLRRSVPDPGVPRWSRFRSFIASRSTQWGAWANAARSAAATHRRLSNGAVAMLSRRASAGDPRARRGGIREGRGRALASAYSA